MSSDAMETKGLFDTGILSEDLGCKYKWNYLSKGY